MCDHETAQATRADPARAVTESQQILHAHDAHAEHKTSAEWLPELADRTQMVSAAARAYNRHRVGGIGTVQLRVRAGMHWATQNPGPVPLSPPLIDYHALAQRLARPHLEITALPSAVTCARHHARKLLWDRGLKELIEPVELVVSELVTNAVRAAGGLDEPGQAATQTIRLWVSPEGDSVLVLVWDASPAKPVRQQPALDADDGRGLFLVELLTSSWGSFELATEPGKVVWALCQS